MTTKIKKERKHLLSIYYTAGYPYLDSTLPIAEELQKSGVNFLEIGFPYSDPVADGPTIQYSSQVALKNGMTLSVLFKQLQSLRDKVQIPVFLMGYLNPVLQYGVENFLKSCQEVGIKGVILPDMPLYAYENEFKPLFEKYDISLVFLVTPQTSEERIRKIDRLSKSFIYLLSSNSTTGKHLNVDAETEAYFKRIGEMKLNAPTIVGFGISDKNSFENAVKHTNGAIIGSAFVKQLHNSDEYLKKIKPFIEEIKK
ncbi:MAG TPA: tryptophan synthase subunit alpha [Sphingobacterium sp.]|nr:tryptophan synthase subunit alpha [Sphingobacterium sp.]